MPCWKGGYVATHPINFVNNFVHYVSLFRALSCVFQVLLLLTTCRLCEYLVELLHVIIS